VTPNERAMVEATDKAAVDEAAKRFVARWTAASKLMETTLYWDDFDKILAVYDRLRDLEDC
jgi:hypothetical protein